MGIERLTDHAVDQIRKTVGKRIKVGLIDLPDISGEHNLGSFTGAGDDRLDLVRRQVLCFIDDEENLLQAAAANVGQRRDEELLRLPHFLYSLGLRGVFRKLMADHRQVVVERLHVGIELVCHIPR